MTEFTKEQLAEIASDRHAAKFVPLSGLADLAAALLAQVERAENAEAERDRLKGELAEAEEAIRYFATKVDLARPAKFHPIDTRRTVIFSCKADGTWNHDPVCSSAVRRAMERGGRG